MNTISSPSLLQLLFIDIETVPQYPQFNQMPERWQELFGEKMAKTMPENSNLPVEAVYLERGGIWAEFGKIICISIGYLIKDEKDIFCMKIKNIAAHDERALLLSFIDLVTKFYQHRKDFQFAGHNIREFDIPYISRRLVINGIPLPGFLPNPGARPWDVHMVDTLQFWKFGDYKHYISLNLLAAALNIPTPKDDISGKDVQRVYYEEKDLPRIAHYCAKDVIAVANVCLHLRQEPILKEENIEVAE